MSDAAVTEQDPLIAAAFDAAVIASTNNTTATTSDAAQPQPTTTQQQQQPQQQSTGTAVAHASAETPASVQAVVMPPYVCNTVHFGSCKNPHSGVYQSGALSYGAPSDSRRGGMFLGTMGSRNF